MIVAEEAVEGAVQAVQAAGGSQGAEIVVFSIILVVILTISLYEYFSTIRWQQATSDIRNEIVFENKNKFYGAYEIRKNYNRNLMYVLFGLIIFLFLLWGGSTIYRNYVKNHVEEDEQALQQVVIDYIEDIDEEDEIIEDDPEDIPEPEPQLEDQAAFLPPVVTDTEVDNDPPVIKDLEKTNVGKENVDGNTLLSDEVVPKPKPPVVKHEDPPIETTVDERADFPGGNAALYKFLQSNIQYPEIAIQLELSGKTVLQFVVNTDGSIQNVKVLKPMRDCRECDQEAVRVVKSMPKWTPGKKGGKAVRSYFVLPVNFKVN